jgi:hypothetical protein
MQSSVATNLGFLLLEVSEDPKALQTLIIDEIERSLPEIISLLRIPPPIDKRRAQLIEFRLAGRPGFRRLNASERQKVTQQLENETFLKSLRKAQEVFSNGIQAGTAKRSGVVPTDSSEGITLLADLVPETVRPSDTRTREVYAPLKQDRTNVIDTQVASTGAQGDLPFGQLQGLRPETDSKLGEVLETTLEIPDIPVELQEPLADRDIRDLLALIKESRLIGFIEASVEKLIPKGIKKIRVPKTRLYAALNLENLIAAYHDLAVSDDVSYELADELNLLDVLIVAMEHEAQWSRINTRRFHLINKKHSIGLQTDEIEELNALDQLAHKQMYAVQKLPFAELATLKFFARRLDLEEGHV